MLLDFSRQSLKAEPTVLQAGSILESEHLWGCRAAFSVDTGNGSGLGAPITQLAVRLCFLMLSWEGSQRAFTETGISNTSERTKYVMVFWT